MLFLPLFEKDDAYAAAHSQTQREEADCIVGLDHAPLQSVLLGASDSLTSDFATLMRDSRVADVHFWVEVRGHQQVSVLFLL